MLSMITAVQAVRVVPEPFSYDYNFFSGVASGYSILCAQRQPRKMTALQRYILVHRFPCDVHKSCMLTAPDTSFLQMGGVGLATPPFCRAARLAWKENWPVETPGSS